MVIKGWRIRNEKKKLNEYNAYVTIAENYKEIIAIISNNSNFGDYGRILEEKYGFDRGQAKLIMSVTIDDLISVGAYREEVKKLKKKLKD